MVKVFNIIVMDNSTKENLSMECLKDLDSMFGRMVVF